MGATAAIIAVLLFSALTAWILFLKDKEDIIRSTREHRAWLSGNAASGQKEPVRIFADNGELIGEYATDFASRMSLQSCKNLRWLNLATISAEDREFFSHNGVSWRGVFRATIHNIISLRPREGAGSITQQLARNLYVNKSNPALIRKFYETWTAYLIEKYLAKDEILCLYLNRIYMGEGRYGAEDASWFYFHKSPEKLTAAEAAMITGIFPSPRRYSPLNNINNAMKKQSLVLYALFEEGHLTAKQIKKEIETFKTNYRVSIEKNESSPGSIGLYGYNRSFRVNLAPDVNEYIRRYLTSIISDEEDLLPGSKVYTTIDKKRQLAAIQSVRSTVESIRNKSSRTAPFPPQRMEVMLNEFNGVFIALEPVSGKILAMVGGFKTGEESYTDRVWSMLRQPGSTIKAFLYAYAIEKGLVDLHSIVVDEAVNISGYKPTNWYNGYKGEISLKEAVALSVNTVPVKLLREIGMADFRRKLSLATDIPLNRLENNLSLALGSSEITPIELARLYGVFLNSGYKINPVLIKKIENADGSIREESAATTLNNERIFTEKTCNETIQLLRASIDNSAGTAFWIKKAMTEKGLTLSVAAKTGTVQTDKMIKKKYRHLKGSHDVWFVAMIPGEVDVVWFGNDSGMPFNGSGSGTAGGAWLQYAAGALKEITNKFPDVTGEAENDTSDPQETTPVLNPDLKQDKNPPSDFRKETPIVVPEEKPVG